LRYRLVVASLQTASGWAHPVLIAQRASIAFRADGVSLLTFRIQLVSLGLFFVCFVPLASFHAWTALVF
jgi:hypothetical protein